MVWSGVMSPKKPTSISANDPRRWPGLVYGVLDLLAAAIYFSLFTWVVPSRATSFQVVIWLLCLLLAGAGVGMIANRPWGHRLARAASVVMLLACFVLILLLVASAAYLHGIYDGIGQAGSAIALLVAFLSFELVGLLPALQLAYLRRLNRGS